MSNVIVEKPSDGKSEDSGKSMSIGDRILTIIIAAAISLPANYGVTSLTSPKPNPEKTIYHEELIQQHSQKLAILENRVEDLRLSMRDVSTDLKDVSRKLEQILGYIKNRDDSNGSGLGPIRKREP